MACLETGESFRSMDDEDEDDLRPDTPLEMPVRRAQGDIECTSSDANLPTAKVAHDPSPFRLTTLPYTTKLEHGVASYATHSSEGGFCSLAQAVSRVSMRLIIPKWLSEKH
jgi:hypothetical protein